MATDRDRRDLYAALETTLGEGPASPLMQLLPARGWDDVTRQSDLAVLRGEIAEVRGELAEVRGEMAELRAELKGEIAELRGAVGALQTTIDAQIPRFIVGSIPLVLGTAGLVFAATRLA